MILFSIVLVGAAGERWPLIELPPRDTVAKRGESVRLDCRYRDASFIEWYFKDAGPLKNSASNSRYVRVKVWPSSAWHLSDPPLDARQGPVACQDGIICVSEVLNRIHWAVASPPRGPASQGSVQARSQS